MCCMVGAEMQTQAVLPGQNTHVLHRYFHTHYCELCPSGILQVAGST